MGRCMSNPHLITASTSGAVDVPVSTPEPLDAASASCAVARSAAHQHNPVVMPSKYIRQSSTRGSCPLQAFPMSYKSASNSAMSVCRSLPMIRADASSAISKRQCPRRRIVAGQMVPSLACWSRTDYSTEAATDVARHSRSCTLPAWEHIAAL
jgi:hypothetical protein